MFLGIGFVLDNKARPATALIGLATAVQTLVFGLFFLAGLVFSQQKNGKTFVKALLGGGALSIIFYLPFLLSFGLPHQANASEWGFLFGMPWYGVLFDLLAFAFFLGFFVLPYAIKKEVEFDTLAWKYAIAAVLLILVQLFLTYRVNIVTALTLAVLSVKLLPENFAENRFARHALTGMFVLGILIASSITMGYSIPNAAMNSYQYLNNNSSSQAHVLNEPALGHSTALFAQRQITADLAVEYADESMINDSYAFLQTGDTGILEEYDVDFVLNRKNFIEVQPVGSPSLDYDLEFKSLDKVYTNGFYFVHWKS
jgi:hypothetical protein